MRKLVAAFCFTGTVMCTETRADDQRFDLDVKPNRCIALHQGQTCYQKLTFFWQTPISGEYCLFKKSQAEPLTCWVGNAKTSYVQKFESAASIIYHIRRKNKSGALATVTVKVAWVYRSNRKSASGWRLF